jgi:hypothetical protein
MALLVLTAGCTARKADANPSWGVAASGRLCPLIDFGTVTTALGVTFDTAAGGQKDETLTCAITQAGHDYPYLTVAVAATNADPLIFQAIVRPSGAIAIDGVGISAYELLVAHPTDGSAPFAEIGWLSPNHRLMVLRYVFAPGTADTDVESFTRKLIDFGAATETRLSSAGGLTSLT